MSEPEHPGNQALVQINEKPGGGGGGGNSVSSKQNSTVQLLTLDDVEQGISIVHSEWSDWRRGRHSQPLIMNLLLMSHLPGKCSLLTLKLMLVIASIGIVYMNPSCVGFVILVFYFHAVPWKWRRQ